MTHLKFWGPSDKLISAGTAEANVISFWAHVDIKPIGHRLHTVTIIKDDIAPEAPSALYHLWYDAEDVLSSHTRSVKVRRTLTHQLSVIAAVRVVWTIKQVAKPNACLVTQRTPMSIPQHQTIIACASLRLTYMYMYIDRTSCKIFSF